MTSLGKPKLVNATTIGYPGSKNLNRNRHPVRVANYQLKKQFDSVNISGDSCNSWYPSASAHSKFNSFYAFRKQNHRGQRPFISGARRYWDGSYYADDNQISLDPRIISITVLIAGGVLIIVWGSERIPYSNRIHLIFISKGLERIIGEVSFNDLMKKYEGKILSETHPDSVRVRLIAKNIIEALQRGLRYKQVGSGQAKNGSKLATHHLDGLKWEILVVNEPTVNAFAVPGGKIVVFTGLLDNFKSDAEVATILAHEVGHVVARHGAETISNTMIFYFLKMILDILINDKSESQSKKTKENQSEDTTEKQSENTNETSDLDDTFKYLLLDLPFSRRMEKEADYIGLLLLASAGYDPRGAPQVYKKLGELGDGCPLLEDYLGTHPSGKKRAQLLSQDKVMEEAIGIYRGSNLSRCIERRAWCGFWESAFLMCFTALCCALFRKKKN